MTPPTPLCLGLFFAQSFPVRGKESLCRTPYGKASLLRTGPQQLHCSLDRLVGDVLLCTGFLSYLGPFNQIFRNYLLKDQWELELKARKIPFTENLNLIAMLVDPPTVSLTFPHHMEFQSCFSSHCQQKVKGLPYFPATGSCFHN